jgi:hypothetical protein
LVADGRCCDFQYFVSVSPAKSLLTVLDELKSDGVKVSYRTLPDMDR